MVARVYSRKGCHACKRRKKKCDECLPSCQSCTRLGFSCTYGTSEPFPTDGTRQQVCGSTHVYNRQNQLAVLNMKYGTHVLKDVSFRSKSEESIVLNGPSIMARFVSPVWGGHIDTLQPLWYLTFYDETVRNAFTACFSDTSAQSGQKSIYPSAYDRALRLLQSRISTAKLDNFESLSIQSAITFLGIMDTGDPAKDLDISRHWLGLIAVMGSSDPVDLKNWPSMPLGWYVWVLEGIIYNFSVLALYFEDLEPANRLWNRAKINQRIQLSNPEGPRRVSNSPVLSGQYIIYDLVREITYLLRLSKNQRISEETLTRIENSTLSKSTKLKAEFGSLRKAEEQKFLYNTYESFCKSLLICVEYLRGSSFSRTQRIQELVAEGVEIFMALPLGLTVAEFSYSHSAWPAQILACATCKRDDINKLRSKLAEFAPTIMASHQIRANRLFDCLDELWRSEREDSTMSNNVDENWPIGMSLLQQSGGAIAKRIHEII